MSAPSGLRPAALALVLGLGVALASLPAPSGPPSFLLFIVGGGGVAGVGLLLAVRALLRLSRRE